MELSQTTTLSRSPIALVCVYLVLLSPVQPATIFSSIEKVGNITTAELITGFGYPVERHTVESKDGFLLNMFRIPKSGPAVLFTHGILLATDTWVLRGPKHDLAFMLSDLGYDVWLADTRGNCYSHKHKTLNDTDEKFWDFSFDEMGTFDVPALIDYILERKPRHKKLFYIGHSLGSTMFFAMCNTRPEYNDKIHLMIALAPAVYFNKLLFLPDNASMMTARSMRMALRIAKDGLATHELLPRSRMTVGTARTICGPNAITLPLCHFIIAAFFGISHPGDMGQIERRYVGNYTSVIPSGTSIKTFDHLMQLALSRKFHSYDYGPKGNMERYGSRKPLQHNLVVVKAPTALFYSRGDMLVPHKNVERLGSELSNLVSLDLVSKSTFNHMDFIWGKDARKMVFERAISLMESHRPRDAKAIYQEMQRQRNKTLVKP
uniref:Lipase n=1 Tax=Cacopsylla melanoneura TaxID=428564 RepID=A0A8D9A6K4_9HEMI